MTLPEPRYRNSAGRLLQVLGALRSGQTYLDCLATLAGEGAADAHEKARVAMATLGDLHGLYQEFLEDAAGAIQNEDEREVILSGLTELRQTIYPIQLNAGIRVPTDAEKSLLKVAATRIPQDGEVGPNDLEAIRASIAALRELVQDANISETVRKTLLELIRLSEDAISRYSIHGARGLKRAFRSMLGESAELYAKQDPDERVKSAGIWATIRKHLNIVDSVASRVLKYTPLFEAASKLLLGNDRPGGDEHG